MKICLALITIIIFITGISGLCHAQMKISLDGCYGYYIPSLSTLNSELQNFWFTIAPNASLGSFKGDFLYAGGIQLELAGNASLIVNSQFWTGRVSAKWEPAQNTETEVYYSLYINPLIMKIKYNLGQTGKYGQKLNMYITIGAGYYRARLDGASVVTIYDFLGFDETSYKHRIEAQGFDLLGIAGGGFDYRINERTSVGFDADYAVGNVRELKYTYNSVDKGSVDEPVTYTNADNQTVNLPLEVSGVSFRIYLSIHL